MLLIQFFGIYLEYSDNTEVIGLSTEVKSIVKFTWRELKPINKSQNTIGESIPDKRITWHTDSRIVCKIVAVGSKRF